MNKKIATMEQSREVSGLFELLGNLVQSSPVGELTHLKPLPAKWVPTNTFPVRIQDIELKCDRSLIVDGRKIEIPFGVKHSLTAGALKKLAGSYTGSLMIVTKNGLSTRLQDDDIIEIPMNGEKVDLKVVPSFATE